MERRAFLSLRTGLRERGHVEGKNIVFEYRFAEDKYERLPDLAAELVRDKVDVIVVHSTPGTRAQAAARSLGIKSQLFDVRDRKELESAFSLMAKARAGAFTVMGDPLFLSQQKHIANLATTTRLPSVFARNDNVEAGGLMSYDPTFADQFRQAVTYVDKIFKGEKPGDLPVENPTRMYLVINLKTAKALGLTIPPSLLQRADHVIE
jgi:ABC-type uncharacterized transport system substrate-binding protein